ncbi:hypothetical protein BRAO375_4670011 [Bradyrhizobium sp. ORS 375]|nr:hypothetical protein BRAO375_4670011 [Bradyrhizobium sp. ORS 375]
MGLRVNYADLTAGTDVLIKLRFASDDSRQAAWYEYRIQSNPATPRTITYRLFHFASHKRCS